jgi:hypothetical protein
MFNALNPYRSCHRTQRHLNVNIRALSLQNLPQVLESVDQLQLQMGMEQMTSLPLERGGKQCSSPRKAYISTCKPYRKLVARRYVSCSDTLHNLPITISEHRPWRTNPHSRKASRGCCYPIPAYSSSPGPYFLSL